MSIEKRVKEIIVEQLGVNESEVTHEAKFVDDLGADSLDLVELVMALEEEYNMEISDGDGGKNICEGKSGIGFLTRFDPDGFETKITGEVKGFNPELYIDKREIKKADLFVQYVLAATKEALEDAQLNITPENSERIGVTVGTGLGGL